MFLDSWLQSIFYKFNGASQFYNCQKFNHSSNNCFFNPVYVQCAGHHRAKNWSVKDRKYTKCANCEKNHQVPYHLTDIPYQEHNRDTPNYLFSY